MTMRRGILGLFCVTVIWGGMGTSCGTSTGGGGFPHSTAWTPAAVNSSTAHRPLPVVIADLDGDGIADVVAGIREDGSADPAVIAYFGHADRTFTGVELRRNRDLSGIAGIAVGDIDGDNKPDVIAACNGVIIYLRQTGDPTVAGNFAASAIDNSSGPGIGQWSDVAIANVDSTGHNDVIAANTTPGRVSWLRSPSPALDGTGWTRIDIDATTRAGATGLVVADINGDGFPDVYSTAPGEASSRVAWYRNPGGDATGTWTKFTIGNFNDATRLAIGDLDRDGDADVVVTNPTDGQIGWYRRPSDPTAAWSGFLLTQYTSATPVDIKTVDVDGNGQMDVVAATSTPGTLRWFTPTSQPTEQWIENNLSDLADSPARRIAVGDIDADGKPDVVATRNATEASSDQIAWYRNPE